MTTRSQSPIRWSPWRAVCTRAPGDSARILAFSSESRSDSIDTSTTSPIALAKRRAHTEPIAPVAPITMARPCFRSSIPIRIAPCLAASSAAAMVRLLPVVTGISERRATVTPASPTTLVKAPSPTMRAPRRPAWRAALSTRE